MKLEDVAKRAGVGIATVSRVLNDRPGVKKSTMARVLRAVEELKYHPNLHASTLAKGESRTLGVIVSNLYNPFFCDVVQAIETDALRHGYDLLLANTRHDVALLTKSVRLMLRRRVTGLAAIVSELDESILSDLIHAGVRTVLYDVGEPASNVTTIKFDYRKGIRMLIDQLCALGHVRLAYVSAPSPLSPTEQRRQEFLDAIERRALLGRVVTPTMDGFAGGREATRELLRSDFSPTAILCVNDWIAVGVLRELRNQGLSAPQDISVTGFDNVSHAEFSCPSLTTIHIPRAAIGHLVFENLFSETGAELSPGREIIVDPELVVRESTGVVATTSR